jgi:hypothetical protein
VVKRIRGVLFDLESGNEAANRGTGAARAERRPAASKSAVEAASGSIPIVIWALAALAGVVGLAAIVLLMLNAFGIR